MKKTSILTLGAAILLTSCGMLAGTSSSDSGHRFSDGIYSSAPSFVTKEERAEAKAENQALVSKTKESAIYLFSDKKDTIIIPENFSAKIQFDPKVGGTTVTVGENPYDWRWDLENRYGYWYGPYSIGASWYWSRHYSPYWSPYWCGWSYSPWRYYSFYDPWYCGGFYDPWYYGGFYDPWYYGGYWGWHDPWHHYHHHHGWYDPHYHRPVGGPSHSGGHGGFRREYASRVKTERTGSYAGAVAGRERTADKSIYNRTAGGGTIRGGSSEGNRISRAASTGRSSVSTGRSSSSTGRSSVSASRPAAARPSAGRGTQSPSYRRPSSAVSSGSAAASSDYRRDNRSYDSDRSSGYSRSSSSSGSYSRSGSYSSPSYSRSSSSSSGGYSRSSSSGGYSRSSSGGYRR